MKIQRRHLLIFAGAVAALVLAGLFTVLGAYLYVAPSLPAVDVLKDVRLQEPMRVYTADGRLLAEFGEQKRMPLAWGEMPEHIVQAFLAAEDDRFFQHPGVDYQGLLRAGINHLLTGDRSQGGGTITMQLTREFFLSREKTYIRKIREIFLAFRIENELTKEEILTLYLNKIFLGNRAYGVGAASLVYFGTDVRELSIAQAAALAATAQRPSDNNPVSGTRRFMDRRNYVLGRLRTLGWIDDATYRAALEEPLVARIHGLAAELEAPYVAEMVRADILRRFGEEAYTRGLRAYATVDSRSQEAANRALRQALQDYDLRHGYRGPQQRMAMDGTGEAEWDTRLAAIRGPGFLTPALVVEVGEREAKAYLGAGRRVDLPWSALEWARRVRNEQLGPPPQTAGDVVAVGDVVFLFDPRGEGSWRLAQEPQAQGALVAVNAYDGSVRALIGGYDFQSSQYNRAAQATRQPGSSFKPFIYSAALERGFTTATVVNDAPVVFEEDEALERDWRPRNDSGRFYGPTRLREALVYSRNLVSIRVLRTVGVGNAITYLQRFGFARNRFPRDLSLALGSGSVSPLEMANGFAVFANGGFAVEPWILAKVEDADGSVLFEADPARVCSECTEEDGVRVAERVVEADNAFLMDDMMRDVVRRGTGRSAMQLGRSDLAGKTGSTNDHTDAWFVGYGGGVSAAAWVGFDRQQPLGDGEFGGRAALPMWIEFMRTALDGVPEVMQIQPPGIVSARINRETGLLARGGDPAAVWEFFRAADLPRLEAETRAAMQREGNDERERDETILF